MNYAEFKKAIVDSEPEDWIYHISEDETEVYILKSNLSISIVGIPVSFEEQYNEDWAVNHSLESKAFKQTYYLKFNNTPIEEFATVWVNDCMATIPVPKRNQDNSVYLDNDDFRIGRIVNADMKVYNDHLEKFKISCDNTIM